jgi:hypothetical protein
MREDLIVGEGGEATLDPSKAYGNIVVRDGGTVRVPDGKIVAVDQCKVEKGGTLVGSQVIILPQPKS